MAHRCAVLMNVLGAAALLTFNSAKADYDAAGIFRIRCATCHGAEGEGTDQLGQALAPALKGNPLIQFAPAEAIATVIRKGRSGPRRSYDKGYPNMPAFGPEAVSDVDALIAYLKGPIQGTSAEQQSQQQPAPSQEASPQSNQPATRAPGTPEQTPPPQRK
jgi:mono/diheme cytochrome c family protein